LVCIFYAQPCPLQELCSSKFKAVLIFSLITKTMKTLLKLLTLGACVSMMVSCDLIWGWPGPPIEDGSTQYEPLVIPVNAYFNTTFSRTVIPEGHIDLKGTVSQLVQTGEGTDVEIGFFQIRLTCCWSLTDCVAGRSGGSLTDNMGNTLFIVCKENLTTSDLTADFPSDQTRITGRFEFAGGTGRFANASGDGTIDCLVTSDGQVSAMAHHWQGVIKNVKP